VPTLTGRTAITVVAGVVAGLFVLTFLVSLASSAPPQPHPPRAIVLPAMAGSDEPAALSRREAVALPALSRPAPKPKPKPRRKAKRVVFAPPAAVVPTPTPTPMPTATPVPTATAAPAPPPPAPVSAPAAAPAPEPDVQFDSSEEFDSSG